MEGVSVQNSLLSNSSQSQGTTMEQTGDVILDIESLVQPSSKCTGSPKLMKALSRKGSNRLERRNGEDQETEEATKKIVVKVAPSQMEQLKQSLVTNKALAGLPATTNIANLSDAGDGRARKLNNLTTLNPRKILLLFASMSIMGTMILIYFTLSIYWRGVTQASSEGVVDE